MINRSKLILVFVSLFLFTACQDLPLYEKSYAFEGKAWSQNVKPKFRVEIKDTTKFYDFTLTLRTTTDYEYNNLWVFLNTVTPSGQKAREPFEIKIQNEDRSWAGKKTGTVVEFPLVFKSRKLPELGTYTFIVEQGITQTKIAQVLDLTYKVSEVQEASN